MKLSVEERLILLDVIPPSLIGDMASGRVVLELRQRIGFTASEKRKLNLRVLQGGEVGYNKIPAAEVRLNEDERKFLLDRFKELDGAKKVPAGHIPVYDRLSKPEKKPGKPRRR